MNEMLIFLLFFVLCVSLTWFILAIPVWVGKYGWKKETIEIFTVPVTVRGSKLPLPIHVEAVLPGEYIDKDIWEDTEIVLKEDLLWGDKRLAGMSKDDTSYLKFKTIHVISINLSYAEEKKFSSETLSRLIAHEYMHRYLDIHEGNSDPYHSKEVWGNL